MPYPSKNNHASPLEGKEQENDEKDIPTTPNFPLSQGLPVSEDCLLQLLTLQELGIDAGPTNVI